MSTPTPPDAAVPWLPPAAWIRSEDQVVILTHGHYGVGSGGKTGIQVLRYGAGRVVGVVEPGNVGRDAAVDWEMPARGPAPVFASLADVLASGARPTRAVVGIAPVGGRLPHEMRTDIRLALTSGIPVLSGLHTFLGEDPEFAPLAIQHQTPIVDLRRPPPDPVCANGSGALVPVPVVTTYGTDTSSGKMTVSVALREAGRRLGLRVAFVATGQTGLLLSPDTGAPIDRVISDFAAGEVERQVVAAARLDAEGGPTDMTPDLIVVEGQGALSHAAYGAVTHAVLLGSFPDALVVCHRHGRTAKNIQTVDRPWPVLPLAQEIDLAERLLAPITGARTVAVCLATPGIDDATYRAACAAATAETGLPATDVLREGAERLLLNLVDHLTTTRPKGKRLPRRPVPPQET